MVNTTLIKIGKILGVLAGLMMIMGGIAGILGNDFLVVGNSALAYSPVGNILGTLNRLILGTLMIGIGILFIMISAGKITSKDMSIGILLLILAVIFSNLLGVLAAVLILIGELVS